MRKTHKVIDKNGYSFSADDRAYFLGSQEECDAFIAEKEHPEHYKVTYTYAEEIRRGVVYQMYGSADAVLDERDEKALQAVLTMKANYDKRLDKSAESAADHMGDFVNNYGCPETAFINLMANKHHTLQQSFTKLCLKWVEKVAEDDYRFDGRNEASHKTCKRLLDNWTVKHPNDTIHMDEEMLKTNPPSRWLPMI